MRGAGAQAQKTIDLSVIYSCPPKAGVKAESAVAKFFLGWLRMQANDQKQITFPDAIQSYKGHDSLSEVIIKASYRVRFTLENDEFLTLAPVFKEIDRNR